MADIPSMSDILSDAPPPAATPEPAAPVASPKEQLPIPEVPAAATPEPKVERTVSRRQQHRDLEQDAQGRVRDLQTGQYVSKEPKAPEAEPAKAEPAKAEAPKAEPVKPAVAAPQQEFTDKEKAFQRAMLEERGKRQELERRMAAYEAAKTAPGATTDAPKTFWDDPEGALAKHQAEIASVAVNARLQTAELIARQKHVDFDEKIEKFGEILKQTPGLHQQWLAAPDPAEFAYNIGRNHLELQAAGSMEEMRAKIERETAARVRSEIEAELRAKAEALARDRAALPPSLSDARASGTAKHVWGGPPSFDEILK